MEQIAYGMSFRASSFQDGMISFFDIGEEQKTCLCSAVNIEYIYSELKMPPCSLGKKCVRIEVIYEIFSH